MTAKLPTMSAKDAVSAKDATLRAKPPTMSDKTQSMSASDRVLKFYSPRGRAPKILEGASEIIKPP